MNGELIKTLKYEFYDWCGTLSVDECVSNERLVSAVENLERLLIATTNWLDIPKEE